MPYADIVTLFFALVAIILPQYVRQLTPRLNSFVVIGVLFLCSLAGGFVYKWMTGESGTPAFSRVFFIAGLCDLIVYAIYNEMYRRLEVRQMQIDHELQEEKEQSHGS